MLLRACPDRLPTSSTRHEVTLAIIAEIAREVPSARPSAVVKNAACELLYTSARYLDVAAVVRAARAVGADAATPATGVRWSRRPSRAVSTHPSRLSRHRRTGVLHAVRSFGTLAFGLMYLDGRFNEAMREWLRRPQPRRGTVLVGIDPPLVVGSLQRDRVDGQPAVAGEMKAQEALVILYA